MDEAQTQPQPQTPPPPPPTPDPESTTNPEGFAPLEEEVFDELPPEPEPVQAFTGEEIVNGTAMILALGLRFQSPEEANAFMAAYRAGIVPMLPPAAVLDALRVGEALAEYGIGKNRLPGMGNMAALPAWLRLVVGGLVLAASAYGGINAAKNAQMAMGGPDRGEPANPTPTA